VVSNRGLLAADGRRRACVIPKRLDSPSISLLGVKQLSGGHGPVSPDTPRLLAGNPGTGRNLVHTALVSCASSQRLKFLVYGAGSAARPGCPFWLFHPGRVGGWAGGCPGLWVYIGQCWVSVAVVFVCYWFGASRGRDRLVRLSVASARSPVRTPVLAGCLPRPRARRGCLRLSRSTLRTKWLPLCQVRSVLRQPVRA